MVSIASCSELFDKAWLVVGPGGKEWPTQYAQCHDNNNLFTVFIRIVAAATNNFSLAGVWLLIKGGSYSRAALLIWSDTSW